MTERYERSDFYRNSDIYVFHRKRTYFSITEVEIETIRIFYCRLLVIGADANHKFLTPCTTP